MLKRRSIRLKDYDYTQNGAYFVTICTHQKAEWFGSVESDEMQLNHFGEIVQSCWLEIPDHFPKVEIDEFVVMPNHLHGILLVIGDVEVHDTQTNKSPVHDVGARYIVPLQSGERFGQPTAGSLPTIIRTYKAAVIRQINALPDPPQDRIWQRNYYEHVVRSEVSLNTIRQYIQANPAQWENDRENRTHKS